MTAGRGRCEPGPELHALLTKRTLHTGPESGEMGFRLQLLGALLALAIAAGGAAGRVERAGRGGESAVGEAPALEALLISTLASSARSAVCPRALETALRLSQRRVKEAQSRPGHQCATRFLRACTVEGGEGSLAAGPRLSAVLDSL